MFHAGAGYMWQYIQGIEGKSGVTMIVPQDFAASDRFVVPSTPIKMGRHGWAGMLNGKGHDVPFIKFTVPKTITGVLSEAQRKVDGYLTVIPAGMTVHMGAFFTWVIMPADEATEFIKKMPFHNEKEMQKELDNLSFYKRVFMPTVKKAFALAVMETKVNNSSIIPTTNFKKKSNEHVVHMSIDEAKKMLLESRRIALEFLGE